MVKCYHYCTNEFFHELMDKQIIYANDVINTENASYVKNYVFKEKKLNKGNGMFFTWTHPDYKGPIKYDEKGKYSLVELEVPENIAIKTNYENWCSFQVDLDEANGNLELADKICREDYGIKDGLLGSYNAIFDLSDTKMEIQVLLPYIDLKWVKSTKNVHRRYI